MKRISFYDWGGPEQLVYENAPQPTVGAGQLLVRVAACSVNPVDWKLMSGFAKAAVRDGLPAVPGGDLAGTVAEIGEGVTGWSVGDEVWSHIGLLGAYAEFVAVDAAAVSHKPASMSFAEAASMPLAGLTAWQALEADGRELAGLTILIHNAAGGVGTAAVQIAKALGARVIGTASEANAAFVRGLGADEVVDFRIIPVSGHARDVDIMIDCVGADDGPALWELIKHGGSVTRIAGGPDNEEAAARLGISAHRIMVKPDGARLDRLAALVDRGKIKAEIAKTFPLADAADAQRMSKDGHVRGKIVLLMPGGSSIG